MPNMTVICLIACGLGIATVAAGLAMLAYDLVQWCKRHRKTRLHIKDAYNGEWH